MQNRAKGKAFLPDEHANLLNYQILPLARRQAVKVGVIRLLKWIS